jgi:hypothetical protein
LTCDLYAGSAETEGILSKIINSFKKRSACLEIKFWVFFIAGFLGFQNCEILLVF